MTQKIFEIKQKLIDELEDEISRMGSLRNMDTREVGMVVDMIKDLAEAEEKCWKACYYKTVVEAMEAESGKGVIGYMPDSIVQPHQEYHGRDGYKGSVGYQGGNMSYSDRMGPMGSRAGYSDQSIQNIKQMMENADPQHKEQLKQDLQKLMQEVGI